MAETESRTYSEEYETEGIAEDSYTEELRTRLRALGAPAIESVRSANHKLAAAATIGGTALFVLGTMVSPFRGRHAH